MDALTNSEGVDKENSRIEDRVGDLQGFPRCQNNRGRVSYGRICKGKGRSG